MTAALIDPSRQPGWALYRAEFHATWVAAGASEAARAALVLAACRQGCPNLSVDAIADLAGKSPGSIHSPCLPSGLAHPALLGLLLETLIAPGQRRRRGSHHTQVRLAERLVDLTLRGISDVGIPSTCDPAVGGGAFLLAIANALASRGHSADAILPSLHGADIDPLAVAVTDAALRWWARDLSSEGDHLPATTMLRSQYVVGDGLATKPDIWGRGKGFDVVVGNPPFLSQLSSHTARSSNQRLSTKQQMDVGGYVDTAGLFLLHGVELAAPGGRIMMIQPESFLSARDADPVRQRLLEQAKLTDIWVAVERVFAASVRVCAPVLEVGSRATDSAATLEKRPRTVKIWRGGDVRLVGRRKIAPNASWGSCVAAARGTPPVALGLDSGCLGDVAAATAGFRDQYYGLIDFIDEHAGASTDPPAGALITAGSIDPLSVAWGRRATRFAKRDYARPQVQLERLAQADPKLNAWVMKQMRPKVLMATQTRVMEVAIDPAGALVPSVPVVAVVPLEDISIWSLAAVLLAPSTSAWALYRAGGAALAGDAVKLSASQLLEIPLPTNLSAWRQAADLLEQGKSRPNDFGALMLAAYGLDVTDPVGVWWLTRLPNWRGHPLTDF